MTDVSTRAGLAAFLRRAAADQSAVGAVAPTSATLSRRLARLAPATRGARVLELGAGTGAISAAIGERLADDAVHLALERDPAMLAALRARTQGSPCTRVVHGDAADLAEHLADHGLDRVDVVLSSLPWSNLAPAARDRLLAAVRDALVPGGTFATIAYRPARLRPSARRFRRRLDASFEEVAASGTTWRNLPPARLVVARGPRAGALR